MRLAYRLGVSQISGGEVNGRSWVPCRRRVKEASRSAAKKPSYPNSVPRKSLHAGLFGG
jgi:hypothetical protein